MKLKLLIFFLGLYSFTFSQSKVIKQLSDSAETYYTAGEYEKAINSYEQIVDKGYEAWQLYYNLGNAYYKSNKLTQAIVNYERAKLLNPQNEDIEYNLELVKNRHVTDKIDVLPELFIKSIGKDITSGLSSDTFAYISIGVFILVLIFVAIFFFSGKAGVKKISFALAIIGIIVSISTYSLSSSKKEMIETRKGAIVKTPSVTILSAPNENGTELFVIHEGLKVSINSQIDDWYEVKLSDGNMGWLKKTDVIVI